MNLPNYNKKIVITLTDRDFYGFVETEGEASIQGQTLIVTTRSNNPMTDEKGKYETSEYPILEYFEELQYLKIEQHPHIFAIFDMNQGKIFRNNEFVRLEKAGFNEKSQADIEEGLHFLAHHLVYLYKVDPQKSVQMLGSIYLLKHQEELQLEDLRIYRHHHYLYLHQLNNHFVMQASVCAKGIVFSYDYIGYYYAGLKKYLGDSLQGTVWKIG